MLTQIINGHILTPGGWVNDGSVVIENGRIREILNNSRPIAEANVIDAKGMHVVPGGRAPPGAFLLQSSRLFLLLQCL